MCKPTWKSNDIPHGKQGGYFPCEKCGDKFSDTEDDPIPGGNGEDDPGSLLYCGKCRVNLKGKEEESKGQMVESSEPHVCRECSQEFHIVEALDLHWKQVCFSTLSSLPFLECVWPANLMLHLGPQAQTNNRSPVSRLRCLV